jgi:hypothetical protein
MLCHAVAAENVDRGIHQLIEHVAFAPRVDEWPLRASRRSRTFGVIWAFIADGRLNPAYSSTECAVVAA